MSIVHLKPFGYNQSMVKTYKPPEPLPIKGTKAQVFLAGSIDMGQAEDWQSQAEAFFAQEDVILLNPRREAWDASWEQRLHFPPFREQVEWELAGLEQADRILMYFAPQSQAPITLLELGLQARSDKLRVVCPDDFWRKGNVEVICAAHGIPIYETLETALEAVLKELQQMQHAA